MKHIKIIAANRIRKGDNTGCGECQSACQSACKTSCTVGNLSCEKQETVAVLVKTTASKE